MCHTLVLFGNFFALDFRTELPRWKDDRKPNPSQSRELGLGELDAFVSGEDDCDEQGFSFTSVNIGEHLVVLIALSNDRGSQE